MVALRSSRWSAGRAAVGRRCTWSRCGRSAATCSAGSAGGLAAGLLVRELVGLPFAQQAYALPDPLGSPGSLALGGGVTVPVRALEVLATRARGRRGDRAGAGADRGGRGDARRRRRRRARPRCSACRPSGSWSIAFLLAGALAGFAGLLIAPQAPIGLEDGVLLGLKGMTAALLVRLGSLRLALAGGLVVGAVEGLILASSSLGARWADTIVLALLVAAGGAAPARPAGVTELAHDLYLLVAVLGLAPAVRLAGHAGAGGERVRGGRRRRRAAARAGRAADRRRGAAGGRARRRGGRACRARWWRGRSRPFVALSTWALAWLAYVVLLGFPSLSGGGQGLTRPALDTVETPLGADAHADAARARGRRGRAVRARLRGQRVAARGRRPGSAPSRARDDDELARSLAIAARGRVETLAFAGRGRGRGGRRRRGAAGRRRARRTSRRCSRCSCSRRRSRRRATRCWASR